VAKIIGCNQISIVNWEKGRTQPQVNKMAWVERFLNEARLPPFKIALLEA
jgi:hypothetical protein